MKMITKTFKKQKNENNLVVEDKINAALRLPFYALVYREKTLIKSQPGMTYAQCETPYLLWLAWTHSQQITFSVTLPARYWK